ncbi:hypothetical protein PR048_013571, partial [Dryococelus australis]
MVIDYYSIYVEVVYLQNGSTCEIVKHLKTIFSRFGIPCIVISDGGPPFSSNDLSLFFKEWNVTHDITSPYMPKSNGIGERGLGTVEDHTDPYLGLLNYQNTPKGKLKSPAELLLSRTLRSKLPILSTKLKPKIVAFDEHMKRVHEYQTSTKQYYDRNAKPLAPLNVGDK